MDNDDRGGLINDSMSNPVNIIDFKNLTKRYKNSRGIKDVSFSVSEGDVFGFLGPNGAGKTTAMKILTGLMKPDSGNVYICGCSVVEDYEQAMGAGVGAIIESVDTFEYLTAYQHLKMHSNYFDGISDDRINRCLELTGISKFKNERIKNFSLGMKQRFGIASAILSDPKVLILDEPYNGLDVEGMVQMREMFRTMAKEKKTTILISSHLIHDVELLCNKVCILYNGKILDVRRTEEILKEYSNMEEYYLQMVKLNEKE